MPIEYASIKKERLETKTASQIRRMILKIISVVKAEIMLKLPQIIRTIPKTNIILKATDLFPDENDDGLVSVAKNVPT